MRKFYSKGVLGCLALLLLVFWFPNSVDSQNPAKWSLRFEGEKSSFNSGDTAKAILRADLEEGWHLYAMEQPPGGPIATTIKIPKDSEYTIAGPISSGDPISQFDSNFNIETKFFKNNAEFNVPLEFAATVDREKIELDVRFQLCTDKLCLPPQTVRVSTAGARPLKGTGASSVSAQNSTAVPTNQIITRQSDSNDLTGFIWLALSLGALSLLTPCVFPMIPITVSYFTNHAGKSKAKAVKLATIYSIGIISTFTLLGMLIAIFVGAAGINLFAANPWVNLLIAAIFLFFAFNLFGAYELGVPTSILTRLDALTRTKEGEGSGIVGALLMGLTFTLTSFTCTSPFVGTILVSASQGSWQMPLIGMFAFSAVFALPFFVLALAPQFVSQMPKAGGWMNSVKVTMGFSRDRRCDEVHLQYRRGLEGRLFHARRGARSLGFDRSDSDRLSSRLVPTAPRFESGEGGILQIDQCNCFSRGHGILVDGTLWCATWGTRIVLPPDLEDSRSSVSSKKSEASNWIKNDLEKAKQLARSEGKRVFIDFTGYTCTNCRWMEANVFPKAEVDEQLNRFVLVKTLHRWNRG